MNNSFSLQQISKTGNIDSNLLSRQNKLNLMAKYMQYEFQNPKLKQSEIADQLGYPSSTLRRYRNDIKMLSPYRIQPNNTNKRMKNLSKTKFDNNSHCEHDLKRPQMTSNDLAKPETNTKCKRKKENKLEGGSMPDNVEINDEYLDENLHINDSQVELSMQNNLNDKTVGSDTIQDLKDFTSQYLTTKAKKVEQLDSMMPAFQKAFDLLGDDIVNISTENATLKNQIGNNDKKWIRELKAKQVKKIDDEKRLKLTMSRMKKQLNK